jgi:PBP1b-binding outer membrane lipoprotein LpoB
MKMKFATILLLSIAVSVSGCSAVRKFTKKNDNTVLSGERKDILSPEQYKVEDATVSGGGENTPSDAGSKPCNPDVDPECAPAVDQEAGDPAG